MASSLLGMEQMSGPPDPPQHPVPAVIAGCAAAIDQVADGSLWSLGDADLLTLLDDAYALVSSVHALALGAVAEAGARDLADRVGAPSLAVLLRSRLRLTPVCARRDVTLAGALAHDRHPALAAALRGTTDHTAADTTDSGHPSAPIRVEQAAAIADVLADAPPAATREVVADAEAALVGFADTLDAVCLRRLGTRIWALVDPDAADATEAARLARQEAHAHATRRLSMPTNGDGTTAILGQLDDLSAAVLRAALHPLAAPLPKTADGPDPRSHGQRLADALVELARRALATGDLPNHGGIPPQLVITVRHEDLPHRTGAPDHTNASTNNTEDTEDTDSHTGGCGAGGIGTLDDGTRPSPTEITRLACEADPVLALLAHGIPTQITRRHRTARGIVRRALILRDGGCAFPGCDRPASWCHAHHITAWQHGGPHHLGQPRPTLRLPPPPHPPRRLDSRHGPRRPPRLPPTTLDRPRPSTTTQHHSPSATNLRMCRATETWAWQSGPCMPAVHASGRPPARRQHRSPASAGRPRVVQVTIAGK